MKFTLKNNKTNNISDLFTHGGMSAHFLVHEAKKRGLDWKEGLELSGLGKYADGKFPYIINLQNYMQFANYLTEKSNDSSFYFTAFTSIMQPDWYDLTGMLAFYMPDLEKSIQLGDLVVSSFGNYQILTHYYDSSIAVWHFVFITQNTEAMRMTAENLLPNVLHLIKGFTEGKGRLSKLEIPYKKPAYHSMYENYFQCPIVYESPRLAASFPSEYLRCRNSFGDKNALTLPYLMKKAHEEWKTLFYEGSAAHVQREILKNLRNGAPSLENIAKSLSMNPRQLQKVLCTQNTSYREILGRIRIRKLNPLIIKTSLSFPYIASRGGFESVTALNSFYKKISGRTPAELRKDFQKQICESIN